MNHGTEMQGWLRTWSLSLNRQMGISGTPESGSSPFRIIHRRNLIRLCPSSVKKTFPQDWRRAPSPLIFSPIHYIAWIPRKTPTAPAGDKFPPRCYGTRCAAGISNGWLISVGSIAFSSPWFGVSDPRLPKTQTLPTLDRSRAGHIFFRSTCGRNIHASRVDFREIRVEKEFCNKSPRCERINFLDVRS
jgi:hypothetical protein